MKRRSAHIVILVAVLLATLASIATAQDEELTLQGLADLIIALTTRVEAIEETLTPPITADGDCILFFSSSPLQRETITKYISAFEEEPGPLIALKAVYYNDETGLTTMQFSEGFMSSRKVTESWNSCEFAGSSEWLED